MMDKTGKFDAHFIEQVETFDTGGGCQLDVIHLKDGRVIALTDEVAVLHKSVDDLWENDGYPQAEMFLV